MKNDKTDKTVQAILDSHATGNGSVKSYANHVNYMQTTNTLEIDNFKLTVNDNWLKSYAIYQLIKDTSFLAHIATPQALIDSNALSPLHYTKLCKNSIGLNFSKILELKGIKSVNTVEQEIITKVNGVIDITELTALLLDLGLAIEIIKETSRSGVVVTKIFYNIV